MWLRARQFPSTCLLGKTYRQGGSGVAARRVRAGVGQKGLPESHTAVVMGDMSVSCGRVTGVGIGERDDIVIKAIGPNLPTVKLLQL